MEFSKKMKSFFKEKGLTNRQVSEMMGGYSESLISRYVNSKKPSLYFVQKVSEYFPDIDVNYMIKEEETLQMVKEDPAIYKEKNLAILDDIMERLEELYKNLSQK